MRTLEDVMAELPPERRQKIEARTEELMAEHMVLAELRKAHKFTRQCVAESLHLTPNGVSRLEKRSDFLLSTLRSYVEAMGGTLSLVAQFPDRQPVVLAGISSLDKR